MGLTIGTKLGPYEIVSRSAPVAWVKSTALAIHVWTAASRSKSFLHIFLRILI
jgi:hypothetical protein